MLNPVAVKNVDRPIVTMDRQGKGYCPLRKMIRSAISLRDT